ncbi:MAG: hypothetical protein ABW156_02325 [Jiangellaceae bacterium]
MRLDGVEVKVSLDSDQTSAAVAALGLADVSPWKIYFLEDVTVGLCSATPLQARELIVRARQKSKGKDDVTIKFRPGRRSQLTDAWLATTKTEDDDLDSELKVEEDWSGERRTLAISLTAERPKGLVAEVAAGVRGISALLTEDQKRLLTECAGMPVNLKTLTMLPPISAMRWPTFAVTEPGGPALDVRAERWTVKHLDFLELSIVADIDEAEAAQAALHAFVERKGLKPSAGEAKTTQVLRELVAQVAC